jgi:allantoin racemase
MHQAHGFLSEHLPVPVINPGPLSYAIAHMLLVTGLAQSKGFYHAPEVPKSGMTAAMLDAARTFEAGS